MGKPKIKAAQSAYVVGSEPDSEAIIDPPHVWVMLMRFRNFGDFDDQPDRSEHVLCLVFTDDFVAFAAPAWEAFKARAHRTIIQPALCHGVISL